MCPGLPVELSSYLATHKLPSRGLLRSIKPFVAATFCCGAGPKTTNCPVFSVQKYRLEMDKTYSMSRIFRLNILGLQMRCVRLS